MQDDRTSGPEYMSYLLAKHCNLAGESLVWRARALCDRRDFTSHLLGGRPDCTRYVHLHQVACNTIKQPRLLTPTLRAYILSSPAKSDACKITRDNGQPDVRAPATDLIASLPPLRLGDREWRAGRWRP